MTLGLVCDACDALSPLSATVCAGCGEPLGVPNTGKLSAPGQRKPTPQPPVSAVAPTPPALPSPVAIPTNVGTGRQCTTCGAELVAGHRFCGSCGARVDAATGPSAGPAKTQFFSAMQAPGRAKLILIKGEGMDGVSYHLAGSDHVAGRSDGAILFPEDPLLSPRHCNFYYRDGQLVVRDEGSANGVFVRIKAPVIVESGTSFLVGEQLLRVDACPPDGVPVPDGDGTYFYGSPKRPARMCVVQLLVGGDPGMVFRARSESISIGREGNDINFPDDPFISGRHALITALEGGRFQLGDYVFLGQQLLRVEIT
jgi:hypothetical protein